MCFQTETSYLNRQSATYGRVKILEVYCISLIRDPNSTDNQTTCVNRQIKYLKYECPRKFIAGYTCTRHRSLITESKNCHFQKFLFIEIQSSESVYSFVSIDSKLYLKLKEETYLNLFYYIIMLFKLDITEYFTLTV